MILPIELLVLIQSFCTFRNAGIMRCVNKTLCEQTQCMREFYYCGICYQYYIISYDPYAELYILPDRMFRIEESSLINRGNCTIYSRISSFIHKDSFHLPAMYDEEFMMLYIDRMFYKFPRNPFGLEADKHINHENVKIHSSWFIGNRTSVYVLCNYLYEYVPEVFKYVNRYRNGKVVSSKDKLLKF